MPLLATLRYAISPRQESGTIVQRPVTAWFTGLSGAGKTTLSKGTHTWLAKLGIHTLRIDGDELRGGVCQDLTFSAEDRRENIRRAAQIAKLLNEQGSIVLVAMISPLERDRQMAREIIGAHRFLEIYVHAELSQCQARDPKGLYARVKRGELAQFTGVDAPYEPPRTPDATIDTTTNHVDDCVRQIGQLIRYEVTRRVTSEC